MSTEYIDYIEKNTDVAELSAFLDGELCHGLSAYDRVYSKDEIMERLHDVEAHPEWELCVSTIF